MTWGSLGQFLVAGWFLLVWFGDVIFIFVFFFFCFLVWRTEASSHGNEEVRGANF